MPNSKAEEEFAASVAWPRCLKEQLQQHMNQAWCDRIIPYISTAPPQSIYQILVPLAGSKQTLFDVQAPGEDELRDAETNKYAVAFLLDVFEVCCNSLLLSNLEKEYFKPFVPKMPPSGVVAAGTGVGANSAPKQQGGPKKRTRKETDDILDVVLYPFSSVLPAEYLLRLLARLPTLISRFDAISRLTMHYSPITTNIAATAARQYQRQLQQGGAADGYAWLWTRVERLLAHLANNTSFIPLSKYVDATSNK